MGRIPPHHTRHYVLALELALYFAPVIAGATIYWVFLSHT